MDLFCGNYFDMVMTIYNIQLSSVNIVKSIIFKNKRKWSNSFSCVHFISYSYETTSWEQYINFTKMHCLNDGDTNARCFCNIFSVIYGVNFPSFTRTCDVLEKFKFFSQKISTGNVKRMFRRCPREAGCREALGWHIKSVKGHPQT